MRHSVEVNRGPPSLPNGNVIMFNPSVGITGTAVHRHTTSAHSPHKKANTGSLNGHITTTPKREAGISSAAKKSW